MSVTTTIIAHAHDGTPLPILPGGTRLTRLASTMFRGMRLDLIENMAAISPTEIRHSATEPRQSALARLTGAPTTSHVPWHCNVIYRRPPSGRLHIHLPLAPDGRLLGSRQVDLSSLSLCGHVLQVDAVCMIDEDGQGISSPTSVTRWRDEAADLNGLGSNASLDPSSDPGIAALDPRELDELGLATPTRAAVLLSAVLVPFSLAPRARDAISSGWSVPQSTCWLRVVTVSDPAAWHDALSRFGSVFAEEDEEPDDDQVMREAEATMLATTTERFVVLS